MILLKVQAIVRFGRSELAEEIFQDVKDGIRQTVLAKNKQYERIRGNKDDKPMFRVQTTPLEVSIVSVPADQSQEGVGRLKINKQP